MRKSIWFVLLMFIIVGCNPPQAQQPEVFSTLYIVRREQLDTVATYHNVTIDYSPDWDYVDLCIVKNGKRLSSWDERIYIILDGE